MRSSLILVLCVAACGDDGAARPDAPLVGDVMLQSYGVDGRSNRPLISLYGPDGVEIGTEAQADANGQLVLRNVPTDATVAVDHGGIDSEFLVQLFTHVQPGMSLLVGHTTDDQTPLASYSVTFPAVAGGSNYRILGPCQAFDNALPDTTNLIMLRTGCAGTSFSITVTATVAGAPSYEAYTFLENASTAAGAATIPNNWNAYVPFNASYTNVPDDVATIRLSRGAKGVVEPNSLNGSAANNMLELSVPATNQGLGKTSVVSHFVRAAGQGMYNQTLRVEQDINTLTYSVDVGSKLLPFTKATFDKPTRKVAWTSIGSGVAAQLQKASLESRPVGGGTLTFEIIVPGDTTEFTIPLLTDRLAYAAPYLTTDALTEIAYMYRSDAYADYAAVIADYANLLKEGPAERIIGRGF